MYLCLFNIIFYFFCSKLLANQYIYTLRPGWQLILITSPGVSMNFLVEENGGLFISDFETVQLIISGQPQSNIDCQMLSDILYQISLEEFDVQQPYEYFLCPNGESNGGTIDTISSDIVSLYPCHFGCKERLANSFMGAHYKKEHKKELEQIRKKCKDGFACPFCTHRWPINSLPALSRHLFYSHKDKTYLDFLP